MKILLVEDDVKVRKMLRLQIGDAREIVEAGSVAEAAPYLTAEIAVIVLDLHLPNGHGRELLARLKDIRNDVPVVVVSGFPKDVEKAYPVTSILAKPAKGPELRAAIRDAEGVARAIAKIRTETRNLKERRAL